MLNMLLALGAGVLAAALLRLPGWLGTAEASVPGVLAMVAVYFLLARRTFGQIEKIFLKASASLQNAPPRFDVAIATMRTAYPLTRYQWGVKSQIDAQIGTVFFLQKEYSKALPYLKGALQWGHWVAGAMLGVIYYKKKDHPQMRQTFQVVVRRAKKASMAWNLYAYLLSQIGAWDEAQKVLTEAARKTGDDPMIKTALLAVQNRRKIKMKVYKEQWYQFHLERPPVDTRQSAMMRGRMGKQARRGSW